MSTSYLLDFTDADGTVESILADSIPELLNLIRDKLEHIPMGKGMTFKISDGQAFSDNLDEAEL